MRNKINSSLMFIAGIILIIIAGLTFITTTWSVMSGIGKIGVTTAVTFLFLTGAAISIKSGLKNTGNTLFILSMVFGALTVLGIGWFKVLGLWFCIGGVGEMFLYAAASAVLLILAAIGVFRLKHRIYGFIMWSSITITFVCLLMGVKSVTYMTEDIFGVILSVYALIMVFIQKTVLKCSNKALRETYHIFLLANTSVLGITALITCGNFVSMAMFMISWLNISLNKNEDIAGGLFSGMFMFMALCYLTKPEASKEYIITLAAFVSVLTILTEAKAVNKTVIHVFRCLALIFMSGTVPLCIFEMFFDWNITSQIGISILLLNSTFLIYKGNSPMKYVQALTAMIFIWGLGILADNTGYLRVQDEVMLMLILTILNFVLTIKFTALRSNLSDILNWGFVCLETMVLVYENTYTALVGLIVLFIATIYLQWENKYKFSKIFTYVIYPWFMYFVLNEIFDCEAVFFGALTAITAIITALNNEKFKQCEMSFLVSLTIINAIYFVIYTPYLYVYEFMLGGVWALKAYINRDKKEWASTLISALAIYLGILRMYEYSGISTFILILPVPLAVMVLSFFIKNFERKLSITGEITAYLSILIMFANNLDYNELLIAMVFSAAVYAFVCFRGKNHLCVLPVLCLFFAFCEYTGDFAFWIRTALIYVISIGTSILGIQLKKYEKIPYSQLWGILFVIGCLCESLFWGFLLSGILTAISSLNKDKFIKKCLLTASTVGFGLAFLNQTIINIPVLIESEYCVFVVMTAAVVLKYIWGGNKVFSMVIYFMGIGSLLYLFADAQNSVADGIILGLIGFVIMSVGYAVKKKKWFLLGIVTLIFVSVYMTKDFWLSLGWWAYLLIVGIILIAAAAVNEWKKHRG